MPIIARIACIVAFLMAGGTLISALSGQIFAIPFVLIPLMAAIGIIYRRAWSAWGFALYTFAQLVPIALVLFRSSSLASGPPGALGALTLAAILIPLFLFAGRSLARTGAPGGRLWPWAAVSLVTTVPLIFFQILVVPTGTMADTLLPGDRILVLHFPKPRPGRSDVIVFHYPIDRRQMYVDRVIGLPGDHIRISGKTVYRNGTALREPYAVHKTTYTDAYRDNFPAKPAVTLYDSEREMLAKDVVNGELVVPAGKYFVLGDNRDLALDSRFWGFVDSGDLIGEALLIYDSEEPEAGTTGGTAGATHHVRWNRLFKLL